MVISLIQNKDFVYYNLHAEQTISSTFFDGDIGIRVTELFSEALLRIEDNLNLINKINEKTVYLDFNKIDNAYKNLNKNLSKISKKCKLLILLNLRDDVYSQLDIDLISGNTHNLRNVQNNGYIMFYFEKKSNKENYIDENDLFESSFRDFIIRFTDDNNSGYHQSSSVYLTKYIDIKKMISTEKAFFIYSIYQLALKIQNKWLNEIIDNNYQFPTLICQNLNSSFIASILSSFLKLDVIILDHLGPINTMYSSLNKKIEESKNYIIVSDVVCLGTEVKIAKNLINFLGGKVFGNISIVKIETLNNDDIQIEEKKLKTISVFNVNKDNNEGIDFEIKTALK